MINKIYLKPNDEKVHLYWTGGAGFIITYCGLRIGIDLYLSDACRGENDDFKRLTLAPCMAEELELDYLISTHDHGDHFDTISVPKLLEKNKNMKIICPTSVIEFAKNRGIDTTRFIKLDHGMKFKEGLLDLFAVIADHGEETPDAIGVIFNFNGKRIFFAGDGTYHDDYTQLTYSEKGFDIMLVAINGQYGNPDSQQAADIAYMLEAKTVIPCHFWMFKEHGGDPRTFVNACEAKKPKLRAVVLAVGEEYTV